MSIDDAGTVVSERKDEMAVYVDDMQAQFGRMKMCHMSADTTEELIAMADQIGVQRKWIQYPDTWKEHFDVSLAMRSKAVSLGAQEVSMQQLVRRQMQKSERGRDLLVRSAARHTIIASGDHCVSNATMNQDGDLVEN